MNERPLTKAEKEARWEQARTAHKERANQRRGELDDLRPAALEVLREALTMKDSGPQYPDMGLKLIRQMPDSMIAAATFVVDQTQNPIFAYEGPSFGWDVEVLAVNEDDPLKVVIVGDERVGKE